MMQDVGDIENTFQRAWALLVRNPILAVPGLIMGAVAFAVLFVVLTLFVGAFLVTGVTGSSSVGWLTFGIAGLLTAALIVAIAIIQTGWVTGMAGTAWATGTATLNDGWSALSRTAGEIFLTMLIMLGLGLLAILLALPTLTLSLWAYFVFFMYAMPAVIIGGIPASRAIGESCRMAARNFWPTLGIAAIAICVSFVAAGIGGEISRMQSFMGGMLAMVIQQAALAYTTLLIVGEYLKLQPGVPVAAAAPEVGPAAP
ncbi:MAG: hypothetical protein JO199_02205 [Candidatus Eremiobacteraeota bacterium]|nr:hypothetical protein [Candidatus Eremiobacteraeota bacterium]